MGANWSILKMGLAVELPLNFVMQRLFLASLFLLPLLVHFRAEIPKDKRTWVKLIGYVLINAVSMTLTNMGMVYESSGFSSVLSYTQPLFVFWLAAFFLREEINSRRLLGVLIGFLGVVLLYLGRYSSATGISVSIILLLSGAFLWAVTVIYYKKFLSCVNPVANNVIAFGIGGIFLFILGAAFENLSFNVTADYLLLILQSSFFGLAMANTLWIFLIKEEETSVVAASSLIVPMIALVFGWILLREVVDLVSVIGIILIFAGVYLVNRRTCNKH
jgi:drug/metabolite transporter (DMT)-like permease